MPPDLPIRTFDPKDDYSIVERSTLPHWAQAGTLCFITWRTWDSLPRQDLQQWLQQRNAWLRTHGVDPLGLGWREAVARLSPKLRDELQTIFADRWESCLDDCRGDCVLRKPELAQVVSQSLLHFDEQRYVITDFVVMPNHVHLLAAFPTAEAMLTQCDSWKHFTAVRLNRLLGRHGRLWEEDQFDQLVRGLEQFEHYRSYIADNPRRARLNPGEFIHFAKDLALRNRPT